MSKLVPTYAQFVIAYPEFLSSPTALEVQRQLDFSARFIDLAAWDTFYSDGVELDAAHNLFMDRMASEDSENGALQGAMGPVSSVSAAGISTSFATASADNKSARDAWYSKTVYGQKLLRLWANIIPPCVMAV